MSQIAQIICVIVKILILLYISRFFLERGGGGIDNTIIQLNFQICRFIKIIFFLC
jgi:hypothetical protein